MDFPDGGVVEVLAFLLPGFVAAAVYYALTPAPRPIPFERVVQALIFTMVIQASLFSVEAAFVFFGTIIPPIGPWNAEVRITWSIVIAGALGLLLAWTTNRDRIHVLLRKLGVTDQTSFSSEWYGALCRNQGYVVLHLKGNRRLYGWPEEWPSVADQGHFVMARAEWLIDRERVELTGVDRIVIRADEVEMVELMSVKTDSISGGENG